MSAGPAMPDCPLKHVGHRNATHNFVLVLQNTWDFSQTDQARWKPTTSESWQQFILLMFRIFTSRCCRFFFYLNAFKSIKRVKEEPLCNPCSVAWAPQWTFQMTRRDICPAVRLPCWQRQWDSSLSWFLVQFGTRSRAHRRRRTRSPCKWCSVENRVTVESLDRTNTSSSPRHSAVGKVPPWW